MATNNSKAIQQLYVAYFNRPADYFGLEYWNRIVDAAHGDTSAVSAAFAASAEYKATYAGMEASQVVGQIYYNLFGHVGDLPGIAYWTALLNAKAITTDFAVTAIAAGAQGSDLTTYNNRVTVASAFTTALDSGAEALAYSGSAANVAARFFIGSITNDASMAAALVPMAMDRAVAIVISTGPGPAITDIALSAGRDTITGGARVEQIDGRATDSLSSFDTIDGGAGYDSLTAVQSSGTSLPLGVSIKNVESIVLETGGNGYTVDGSAFDGLRILTVTDTAQAGGAIVVDGDQEINVVSNHATSGTIAVGTYIAPTGQVRINETVAIPGAQAAGAIAVVGGSEVVITEIATNSGAAGTTATQSAITVRGTASTSSVTVTQSASVAADSGKPGLAAGDVVIIDVNAGSTTTAGKLGAVSLTNFGNATVYVNGFYSVVLAGSGISFTQHLGAFSPTIEAVRLNRLTMTGTLDLGVVPKTVNLLALDSELAYLFAPGVTTLNIGGPVTISAHTLDPAAKIFGVGVGAITFTGAILPGQTYTGGGGVDTITLSAGASTAITTELGNDVVTYTGPLGAGGSLDGGGGADTLVMTAADAASVTSNAALLASVSHFEILALSGATGAATAINMANAAGMNTLQIAGATGGTLAISNAAANFTLSQTASSSAPINVALANDGSLADHVNLTFAAADGFANTGITTIANVESINITTTNTGPSSPTALILAPIAAAAATAVTIAGYLGVNLTGGMTQTVLTSLDASGLITSGDFGGLTWTAGALSSAATVKGAIQGSNVIDFSAASKTVTYTGGTFVDTINFATANAQVNVVNLGNGNNVFNGGINAMGNNTIIGGRDVDIISVGNGNNVISAGDGADLIAVGSGANKVTLGGGADTLTLTGANASSAVFTTITDIAAGDMISNGALTAFANATGKLGAALNSGVADYQTFLSAAAGKGAGVVSWFQFGGDTYIVEDVSASGSFAAGTDIVIKLAGLVDLSNATVTNGGHMLFIA